MDKTARAKAFELYRKGHTDKAIGEALFFSYKTIYSWRKQYGLPAWRRAGWRALIAPAQYLEAQIEELETSPSPQAAMEAARLRRILKEGVLMDDLLLLHPGGN